MSNLRTVTILLAVAVCALIGWALVTLGFHPILIVAGVVAVILLVFLAL